MPNLGARSIEKFWVEFSNRYNPTLTEEVALAARAEQAQQPFTSTPHQPANACFVPSLLPNVGETGPMEIAENQRRAVQAVDITK